jgi:glycosyltransferase involved in cell wall biosynthesis
MKLSVIIIVKDEEEIIKDCLKSAAWADEIVLVDTGSIDKTLEIAKSASLTRGDQGWRTKVKIYKTKTGSFSDWRNLGFKKSSGDWILYIDADERIPPELRDEIKNIEKTFSAFRIPRKNYYFGKRVKYGGSWPDYVTRLFKRKNFISWEGIIHESPKFKGDLGTFKNPLIHLTHRDLSSSLEKSREWTFLEAKLFYQSNHPSVTWWRVLKTAFQEFLRRAVFLKGYKDGFVGIAEAYVQAINRMMVYIFLWEMQKK